MGAQVSHQNCPKKSERVKRVSFNKIPSMKGAITTRNTQKSFLNREISTKRGISLKGNHYKTLKQSTSEASFSMSHHSNHLFEIYVIGENSVGKTSLVSQYCDLYFDDCPESTFGLEFKLKKVKLDDKLIQLQIWDTPRNIDFENIKFRSNIKKGFLALYDISDSESFSFVETIISEIRKSHPYHSKIFLIGNKTDLKAQRQVSIYQAEKYAQEEDLTFFEISTKENINIPELFFTVIAELLKLDDEIGGECMILNQSKATRIEDIELF